MEAWATHGNRRSFCISVRTLNFMWSFSISWIHCSGCWFSDLEVSKAEIVREKKPIHELVIEIPLAFYLLSCFDFSRAYLSCLSSKGHFYTCANKQWSVHEGHSTVAVCEGCSERLSFNTAVHGKPNFQLYVSARQVFLFPVSMLQGNSEYSLLQALVSLPRFIPFHPFLCQV